MLRKVALVVLLPTLMICGLTLIYKGDEKQLHVFVTENANEQQQQPHFQPSRYVKHNNNLQAPEEISYSNEKKPTLLPKVPEHNDKQQPTLSPKLAKDSDEKQQNLTPLKSAVKFDDNLLNAVGNRSKLVEYVMNLSSSQANDLMKQLGISNLTSRESKKQFFMCVGYFLLKKGRIESSVPIIPPSHQHCKTMSFKNSGPTVALASYPGSGNSWIRQLLESATGIYTGARVGYCDPSYIWKGMIGQAIMTNNVIAVKDHSSPYKVTKIKRLHYDKAIYIVRSPFGVILADHNRQLGRSKEYKSLGNSHVVEANYSYENNPEWDDIVTVRSHNWKEMITKWLNFKEIPVLFVGYENLKKDTYTELKRMLDFIGYPYTEDDILCTIKNSGEAFHRKHTQNISPYSPELQAIVLNEIKEVDAGLLKHNISLYHPYDEN